MLFAGAITARRSSETTPTESGYLEKLSLYCQAKNVDLLSYCLLSNHFLC